MCNPFSKAGANEDHEAHETIVDTGFCHCVHLGIYRLRRQCGKLCQFVDKQREHKR